MQILTTSIGSYPRIGDKPEQQILRRTIALWEEGKVSNKKLKQVQDDLTESIILEQKQAGIDIPTDGLIRWYDPISHMVKNMKNVKIAGLHRFFDTNFYYRRPIFTGLPELAGPIVINEYKFARQICEDVKPVLTGPYTIASLSIIKRSKVAGYFNKLVIKLSRIIAKEIKLLSKAGARIIQIDEPAALSENLDKKLFEDAVTILSEAKNKSRIALCFYFVNICPYYQFLQELPVDILFLDFTYSPGLYNIIKGGWDKKDIGFGIVDGRNTKMEEVNFICKQMEDVLSVLPADARIYIHPSCGLEFLPRQKAYEKLLLVTKIKKQICGTP